MLSSNLEPKISLADDGSTYIGAKKQNDKKTTWQNWYVDGQLNDAITFITFCTYLDTLIYF